MNKSIAIINEQLRNQAIKVIKNLPLDPAHKVVISGYKTSLSDRQRRLYWMWLRIMGNEIGYTKDEMAYEMKRKFLVGIFERDETKEEYGEMIQALRDLYKQDKDRITFLLTQIVGLTSITDASVENMIEYLTEIDNHARGLNINLPHPSDLQWQK